MKNQTRAFSLLAPLILVLSFGLLLQPQPVSSEILLLCWGDLNGGLADTPNLSPFALKMVSAGIGEACALGFNRQLYCWGNNLTGDGRPSAGNYSDVCVADGFGCGLIAETKQSTCWGAVPKGEPSTESQFKELGCGWYHVCGILLNRTVVCWGDNSYNQSDVPTAEPFLEVAPGKYHTCGLLTNGTVLCWGSITTVSVPSGNYTTVVSGRAYSCGLTTQGHALCWGKGNTNGVDSPPDDTFIDLCGGDDFMIGLLPNRSLVVWGADSSGEDNVPGNYQWSQLSAGNGYACGLAVWFPILFGLPKDLLVGKGGKGGKGSETLIVAVTVSVVSVVILVVATIAVVGALIIWRKKRNAPKTLETISEAL